MRVLIAGGERRQADTVAAALRAAGLELAEADAPYDLLLTLGAPAPDRLCRGRLSLDLARRRAWWGGTAVPLTPFEFALLAYLARAAKAVSRDELLRELWGYSFDPRTNSVAVHVSRLRGKLGREAIVTGPDGYRLVEPSPR